MIDRLGTHLEIRFASFCDDHDALPPAESKLVFHRYGDRYFLAQIWTAGYDQGRELPKSSRETEVAQDYPVQNVVLAATLR